MTSTTGTNWREYITDEERQLENQWSMWGSDCIQKVGRKWDSLVPGAPLFGTKHEAFGFLTRFICDALPLRCRARMTD